MSQALWVIFPRIPPQVTRISVGVYHLTQCYKWPLKFEEQDSQNIIICKCWNKFCEKVYHHLCLKILGMELYNEIEIDHEMKFFFEIDHYFFLIKKQHQIFLFWLLCFPMKFFRSLYKSNTRKTKIPRNFHNHFFEYGMTFPCCVSSHFRSRQERKSRILAAWFHSYDYSQ